MVRIERWLPLLYASISTLGTVHPLIFRRQTLLVIVLKWHRTMPLKMNGIVDEGRQEKDECHGFRF